MKYRGSQPERTGVIAVMPQLYQFSAAAPQGVSLAFCAPQSSSCQENLRVGAFLRNAVRHERYSLQGEAGIIWRSSEEWQVPPAVWPDATSLDGAWHCAAEAAVGEPLATQAETVSLCRCFPGRQELREADLPTSALAGEARGLGQAVSSTHRAAGRSRRDAGSNG